MITILGILGGYFSKKTTRKQKSYKYQKSIWEYMKYTSHTFTLHTLARILISAPAANNSFKHSSLDRKADTMRGVEPSWCIYGIHKNDKHDNMEKIYKIHKNNQNH